MYVFVNSQLHVNLIFEFNSTNISLVHSVFQAMDIFFKG